MRHLVTNQSSLSCSSLCCLSFFLFQFISTWKFEYSKLKKIIYKIISFHYFLTRVDNFDQSINTSLIGFNSNSPYSQPVHYRRVIKRSRNIALGRIYQGLWCDPCWAVYMYTMLQMMHGWLTVHIIKYILIWWWVSRVFLCPMVQLVCKISAKIRFYVFKWKIDA